MSAFVTPAEAASMLHHTVSRRTVMTLIHQGELNHVKFGKRYYLSRAEVERFISECPANANQHALFSDATMAHGSSSMAENTSGQDLVRDFVMKQSRS
ncbi:hypothetical protein BV911_17965 [Pseudoruegeria sp. SK021]|nr:hypothetical protein BV911_17965 [Pseudoruegeria sp. SK021]